MGDVVDFEAFKAAKLKRLEDEWAMYMDRASVLQKEGKRKFADAMIAKAKALRPKIDKLRKPKEIPPVSPVYNRSSFGAYSMSYTFEGLSAADMGHRKSEVTPEPENN